MTQRIAQSLITAAAFGCLAVLVLITLFLDFVVAAPALRIALLMTIGVLGVTLGTLLYVSRRTRLALIGLALFVILNVTIWTVDWNSRKPFVRDLHRIQPGMRIAEVDQIMSPYMRSPAAPGTITDDKTVGYRHTLLAWGNSDIGLVRYNADGYVNDITFLPD